MNLRNFFAELKRRNVYKVAVAYAIVGWLVMQIAATVVPALHLSDAITSAVVLLVILGFPIALVIAWAFELTPEGLKRTEDVDLTASAHQPRKRAWIFVVVIAALLSISLFFLGRFTASPKQNDANQVPAKSIAVLPFQNLSEDKSNAFFADGVQDEILTHLAKIADLNSAIARDPSFFAAYCQLVFVHDTFYSVLGDHTPARLAMADAALQGAARLRPDAAETHLARASHLYYALRDYDGALAELEIARRGLANDPRIFELTGYILRRQGKHEEGLRELQRAVALDARNPFLLTQIASSYEYLRLYPEETTMLDRALSITPDDLAVRSQRALVDWLWKADPHPLHQMIERVRVERPDSIADVADNWLLCALVERDWPAAEQALLALGNNPFWGDDAIILQSHFGEGLLARAMRDDVRAGKAFAAARLEQEQVVQKQQEYGPALCVLALIDAGLGNKEVALEEGRRAIQLLPVAKDSINGERLLVYFTVIAAWVGEKDLALEQLERVARTPGGSIVASYGSLKLLAFWDPLRGDPRFGKIVASLAPK